MAPPNKTNPSPMIRLTLINARLLERDLYVHRDAIAAFIPFGVDTVIGSRLVLRGVNGLTYEVEERVDVIKRMVDAAQVTS